MAAHVAAEHTLRIVAFGSSSTQGAGASTPAASYPAQLEAELRLALPDVAVTVVNSGVGGQDAEDFHGRLGAVVAERPDLVIFQTGTNDPLHALPLERFSALTRADLQTLRDARIDVLLMEPQFCRVFAHAAGSFAYVEAIRGLAASLGLPVIRRWDLMRDWLARRVARPEELQAPDGLHMADRGYALLAHEVARRILGDITRPALLAGR